MKLPYIADLHCHPSFKPANGGGDGGMLDPIPSSDACQKLGVLNIFGLTNSIVTRSQTHLSAAKTGNVRLMFASLMAPERPFFDLRNVANLVLGKQKEKYLAQCITGFSASRVNALIREVRTPEHPVAYFDDLQAEYAYCLKHAKAGVFAFGEDYEHVATLLGEPDTVVFIPTIEGAHNLTRFKTYGDLDAALAELEYPHSFFTEQLKEFRENIQTMKRWGDGKHAPLFVTLNHHFWNLMGGHARTFRGFIGGFGVNQAHKKYGKVGLTGLGKEVIQLLLSRENGRRVLIDVKHLSVPARKQFYGLWKQYREQNDLFPIVCSHAAYNGLQCLADERLKEDIDRYNEQSFINRWGINLTDEDVYFIHASRGLIGLILHEDRISGDLGKMYIKAYREAGDTDALRDSYVRLLMANLFGMVKAINNASAWDVFCIGSDFDGLVNDLDIYPDYGAMEMLTTHIRQFLHRPLSIPEENLDKETIKHLMFGMDPDELVAKLMYKNVDAFLQRYYNVAYLEGAQIPVPLEEPV